MTITHRIGLTLVGLSLTACGTPSDPRIDYCALDGTLDVSTGEPGTEVVFQGGPVTDVQDTLVRVGGESALVANVAREDCTFCDACINEAGCDPCGTACSACTELCATCVQSVTFVIPEVDPGPTTVVIQNLWGSTDPIAFDVLPGQDTGYTGSRRRRSSGFRLPAGRPFTD